MFRTNPVCTYGKGGRFFFFASDVVARTSCIGVCPNDSMSSLAVLSI